MSSKLPAIIEQELRKGGSRGHLGQSLGSPPIPAVLTPTHPYDRHSASRRPVYLPQRVFNSRDIFRLKVRSLARC